MHFLFSMHHRYSVLINAIYNILCCHTEENDPLIPKKTVFVLTTNSKYIPSASTSQIGLNRCANERFFERPEVIKAFKEQQDIQIPEFTEVPEHDMVPSKLRARNGVIGDMVRSLVLGLIL